MGVEEEYFLVDPASRSPEPAATVVVRAVPDLGDLIKRQLDTQKVSGDEHASQQMHRDGRGSLANVGPIAGHPDGSGDRLAVAELHGEAHRADRLVIRATPGPAGAAPSPARRRRAAACRGRSAPCPLALLPRSGLACFLTMFR